ncbi:PAS domain S-box protein [Sphingomonas sp. CA1-15]|uniref:histidine kinase n=2 Tax=Sphingomonas immobilis TaxID=3063997 RepID=A0ABT9A472_9SPHN|nr:PAS domain S-box protein [Sphingomonas sp. CA1-15]
MEREALLTLAMEVHGLATFDWDVPGGAIHCTIDAAAPLETQSAPITDFQGWTERVEPSDVAAVSAAVAAAEGERRDRVAFRYHFRRIDGSLRTIEATARCQYDAAGRIVRLSGISADVTEREAREAELIAREAQMQSILQAIPSAMVVIDDHGAIRRFSPAAEALFGYEASEVLGENVAVLTPDSIYDLHDGYLKRYRETGEQRVIGINRAVVARRRDGTEFPMELSIGEALVDGQRLFTGFMRDLSDRHAAEQTAEDLRNELVQVSRVTAMGEMAASLAHELNQPLAATANFLAATKLIVERGGDIGRITDLVGLANEQIQRAGHIIRNIREFIAKREVEIGIEPIEKTIRDSVGLVLVGAARTEVEVRFAFHQTSDLMVADRVQIQQVMVNLLRNASEAVQKLPPLSARMILIFVRDAPEDMIEITVSDTGAGIDPSVIDKLFTTPVPTTKGAESMGVGLSICRRIVEAHGGTLTAENRYAGGATFRFTVPVATTVERDDG